jgi:hypothetical protein
VGALALAGVARTRGSRSRTWTDAEARSQSRHWRGCNPPEIHPNDMDWRYAENYPTGNLVRLIGTRGAWIEWLQEEDDERSRHGGSWRDEFTQWWTSDPTRQPVVIVEDSDGRPLGIWDGWHRTAVSIAECMETLPAFVGRVRVSFEEPEADE